MFKSLKLITFDATNTLLQFKHAPGSLYGIVAARHGIQVDPKDINLSLKNSMMNVSRQFPNFGTQVIGWQEWWKLVVQTTLRDYTTDIRKLDKITKELIDIFSTGEAWKVSDGCTDVLDYLKRRQVTLGVISNSDSRLNGILESCKLRDYFSFVITSYDVGMMKPDARIFEAALDNVSRYELTTDKCMHIGDDYNNDYLGALNARWNSLLLSDKPPPDVPKERTCRNFEELFDYFLNNDVIDDENV